MSDARDEGLWTAEEVGAYLQVSPETVATWSKRGQIPTLKVGSLNRYDPQAIREWARDNARPVQTDE